MHLHWSGLRVRLLGLVLLSLLPGLAFFLYNASDQRLQSSTAAQQDALRLARLAAANQKYLIEGARFLLIPLSQLPAIRNQDAATCSIYLANLLANYPPYANFGAVDREGNIFCMALELKRPVNIADRAYFQGAVQNREFSVGDYQISRSNGLTVITFGYPVFDGFGQVQGIVFAGLDLNWLNGFIAQASLPQGTTLSVIDRNGTVLADYPRPEHMGQVLPELGIVNQVLAQGEGVTHAVDVAGTQRLYAFTPLYETEGPDAYVIVSIPNAVAFERADRNLTRDLGALCLGAVLALAATWLASGRFVLDQVTSLLDATRRLAAGDLSARTKSVQGSRELVQLSHAFDDMAERLEQREAERRRDQEQIQRQKRRAETLARIATHLNAHLHADNILDTLSEETARALNVPAASVNLYEKDGLSFHHAGGLGLPPNYAEQARAMPFALFDDRRSPTDGLVAIEDVEAVPDLPGSKLYRSCHIRAVLAALVQRDNELIGSLNLFSFAPRHWTEDERFLLKSIAEEAALAISNARLYTALRQEERARAHLLHKVITAQENERLRIARELHDETGQSLSALLLGLDVGEIILQEDTAQAVAHLEDLKAIAARMLEDTHRLIADLRPSLLDDLGLVPAITWYGDQRLSPLGITLSLNEDAPEERLPRSTEAALFRIVQEGITNVVRHAHATAISVNLVRQDGHLSLEIADNGTGFDPRSLSVQDDNGRGLGVRGMQERAEILGGEFELQSSPGLGTVITVRIPVPEEVSYE